MQSLLTPWGGDGEGVWSGEGASLGHLRRVATDAEREGPQPLQIPEAPGVVISADARLDEPQDLRRLLDLPSAAERAMSDAELILRAYLRWADRCAERLYGAFAFAIWDGRRKQLFLARDHIGERPLHLYEGRGFFLFATSAEAVVAHPAVPRRVDEVALAAHLVGHAGVLLERSPFVGVTKLPPGHALVRPLGGPARTWEYWSPERIPEQRLESPAAYAEALRAGLERAVDTSLRTHRPIAAHLSGGLDSSLVTVLAGRLLERDGRRLERLFSWSPPPTPPLPPDDERGRVERIAGDVHAPVVWCRPDATLMETVLERDLALEPNDAPPLEHAVLAEARAAGIGVILSGWGGDEVASFNGRGELTRLLRTGRWLPLIREAAAPARREHRGTAATLRHIARVVAYNALPALLPEPLAHAVGLARRDPDDVDLLRTGSGLHPAVVPLVRDNLTRSRIRIDGRRSRLAVLRNGHITARLETWAYAGAHAGVEYRYPLLDRRLMELCLSFPASLWRRSGYTRWVFRAAAAPLLPDELVWGDAKEEPVSFKMVCDLIAEARAPEIDAQAPPETRFAYANRRRLKRSVALLPPDVYSPEAAQRTTASLTSSTVQADAGRETR